MAELKAKKIYLNNKDLYCELIVSKAKGKLTPAAQKMLILLGKNAIRKFSYKDEEDKYDCLQNGYLMLFKYWYSFDEEKGTNAFAWATEVFKRGAARGWNNMHKTKGEDVEIISLTAYDNDGHTYDRF